MNRNPRSFFEPLALGAPTPARDVPFRPSRMIHFFDPSNAKMRSKVADLATKADVLLGNLEDAVAADKKVEARRGFIQVAQETDFGRAQLWTRVNALDSPWFLDDVMEIVEGVGDKLDVIMVPKVEGPWDQFRNAFLLGCVGAWSLHPVQIEIARRVFSPPADEVLWAKRVIEEMGDGTGAVMIDGKMQDDATVKQCKVMVELAQALAEADPELRTLYELE